jgi:phage gp36-like protein
MAFCTTVDVLTNINMAAANVPSLLLAKSVVKGEAEVRAAFSSDLLVALDAASSTPAIIKSLTEDIASYYVIRGLYSGRSPSTHDWVDRYKEAKETLSKIADGTIQIEGVTVDVGAIQSNTKEYKSTFDERDETDWETDPDKLEDLADG